MSFPFSPHRATARAFMNRFLNSPSFMYKHCDTDDTLFSLHDCHAEKITFEKGVASFYFPGGFWILATHPENMSNAVVRSDASQVKFHLADESIDAIGVYIFTKTQKGRSVREEWEPEDFMHAVNRGTFRVEFIQRYQDNGSLLYKCWLWLQQKPYHKECEITIDTVQITYCWNNVCPENTW